METRETYLTGVVRLQQLLYAIMYFLCFDDILDLCVIIFILCPVGCMLVMWLDMLGGLWRDGWMDEGMNEGMRE